MENKQKELIEKFKNYYKDKEITKHEGSFSPIVWGTAASSLESPLYRKYYPNLDFGPVAFLIKENQSVGFFSFDSYLGCAEDGLKRYLDGTFKEFEDMNKINKEINELYKKYSPKKISKLKEKEFYELFQKIFSKAQDLQIITLFCEALYEDIVKKYFNKLKKDENVSIEDFFNTASLVFFESFFGQLDSALIDFNEDDLYLIQWAFSDYMGTPKLEDIPQKINILIKEKGGLNKIKQEKEKLKEEILKNKRTISKFRKTINPDLLKLFEFTQETIKIRDLRKKDLFNCITLLSNFGRESAKRKNISENLMPYIIRQDIKSNLCDNKDYENVLKKRKAGNLFYYDEKYFDEVEINYEKAKKEIFDFMDRNKGKEIKGNSAQKGFAKGKAKVILNQSQFSDFEKGDILVTSMTRPEFVPLMKKASAIVTDEGGLTCHAAIISRELRKPCIIGTQNASRLIKNGDLVEVDANNSVVRILEKTETKSLKLVADRDHIPLYPWFLADECLTGSIKNVIGEKIDKNILEFKKDHIYYYIDVDKFNKVGENLLSKIIEDHKFYSLVEKNVLKKGDILMEFCGKISKIDLSNLSNAELKEIYSNYAKKLKTMRDWGWIPPLLDGFTLPFLSDYLKEKFRSFLKKIGKEKELENYYAILSSSENKSEVQTEEVERLKLTSKIDKNLYKIFDNQDIGSIISELKENHTLILRSITNHAKKFNWLTYGYNGPLMNESDVIKLIKISLKDALTINEQLEKIKSHYKILRKEKKKIIKELNLSKDLIYLFEVSSFFMYLKDLRKGIYQKSYVLMDPVMDEIAKRMKLSNKEIRYLNRNEIREGLINNQYFKKIARERTKYCVALIKNGETQVYQGEEAKAIIKKNTYSEKIDENIMELKGTVAYPGKLRGVAKIISVVKDMTKINNGDIMISPTTNPDLIMAMKMASAFVTDLGGITSHAAIVAREMKKPCVVGTKVATKIIKDGDLVEVDANKGIIKIIKKKNGN